METWCMPSSTAPLLVLPLLSSPSVLPGQEGTVGGPAEMPYWPQIGNGSPSPWWPQSHTQKHP